LHEIVEDVLVGHGTRFNTEHTGNILPKQEGIPRSEQLAPCSFEELATVYRLIAYDVQALV
jgi:hypothetical protein